MRDYGVITLEDAVHKITDVPARLYGLRERGRIASGYAADRHAAALWPRYRDGHAMSLRIEIDREKCMGSGNCVYWAPSVFDVNNLMVAVVIGDPDTHAERVRRAAENCPTNAITITEG